MIDVKGVITGLSHHGSGVIVGAGVMGVMRRGGRSGEHRIRGVGGEGIAWRWWWRRWLRWWWRRESNRRRGRGLRERLDLMVVTMVVAVVSSSRAP